MEVKIYIIIGVLLVIIVACALYLRQQNKPKKLVFDSQNLLTLFDASNIINVDFVRNKIVVVFKDVSNFDVNTLQEQGAKGISVIGDKLKFFISDDELDNKKLYNELVEYIER